MKIIKTKTFQIAVYEKGDENSDKMALVIPGRLDTKDYIHLTSLVDHLASKGFFAVAFDPPGTWESPGSIALYSTTNTLKATDELIEYYGNRPTLLVGHSRGGCNAMLSCCSNRYATGFVAIMSDSGPSKVDQPDENDTIHMSYRDMLPGTTRTAEQKEFPLPVSYFADNAKYDAKEGLANCQKPKLFFYGTQDVLVSEKTIRDTYDLSAEPKMIHELNTEHDYRLHPDMIGEVNNVIDEFIAKYGL